MAHVRKSSKSPYWYADFFDAQGQRHQPSTNCRRRADAQRIADAWEREAQSVRDPRAVARDRATLRTALDLLSEHLHHQVAARSMSDATARFHVAKAKQLQRVLGRDRLLASINTAVVRDYCRVRREPRVVRSDAGERTLKGAGSSTLVKEVVTLRLALRLAKERQLWDGDLETLQPADLSASYSPRSRVLTSAEVDAIRPHLPSHRWRVVAFALAVGAERSTWTRVELRDVDLGAGFVRVRGTKRASRDREVPVVLDRCRELLREAIQGAPSSGPIFRPWESAGRDLQRAARLARIDPFTPNDLRRSFATWHVEAGVSLDVLFRAMGHRDTTMLARVYARPKREQIAEQMRAQIAARSTSGGGATG